MHSFDPDQPEDFTEQSSLTFLAARQVSMIDEALSSLGDFGEVRLVVEKGQLRFLVIQKSIDVRKWQHR